MEDRFFQIFGSDFVKDLSKVYEKNYHPLSYKIKEDFIRWNIIPFLNLSSRIETIKINILPSFLNLFQTLPVMITKNQFAEWDKIISRFLWQGKPWVWYKTLQLSKQKCGWGLPSLRNYYISTQMRSLLCWCNPTYKAQWKDTECSVIPDFHIQAALPDQNLQQYIDRLENLWVKSSLKIWTSLIRKHKLYEDIKNFELVCLWFGFHTKQIWQ